MRYPHVEFDLERDCFVVWLRWVEMRRGDRVEELPENRGIRVELQIDRGSVLGPSIVYAKDLGEPVYLRANGKATRERLFKAKSRGFTDLQLIIHGSVAQAPYAALYHLRDYEGEAIDTQPVRATPLIQVQPSVPAGRWRVSGQANLRVSVSTTGDDPRKHLHVLR